MCAEKGIIDVDSHVRPCFRCLQKGRKCTKFLVLCICTDSESRSVKLMNYIRAEQQLPESLRFLSHVADCIHIEKSFKSSISNWFLVLDDQRCNLSIVRNLREDPKLGIVLRKHLSVDCVRHKDRMDDSAPRQLANPDVLQALRSVDWVVHPLIPEKWRLPTDNVKGMIKQPIAICLGNISQMYILDAHTKNIFSGRMHYPVQVKVLYKGFNDPTDLDHKEGFIFVTGKETVYFIDQNKKLNLKVNSMNREDARKLCQKKKLITSDEYTYLSLNDFRKRLATWAKQNKPKDVQILQCNVKWERPTSVCVGTRELLYVADMKLNAVFAVYVDQVDQTLEGNATRRYSLDEGCIPTTLAFHENHLYMCDIGQKGGVFRYNDADNTADCIVLKDAENSDECGVIHGMTFLADKSIIITDSSSRNVKILHPDGTMKVIAGCESRHQKFGTGEKSTFGQPTAICSEGRCAYLVDTANATICLLTGTTGIANYLEKIGQLYDIFSVHANYRLSVDVALNELDNIMRYFDSTVDDLKVLLKQTGTVQGPQGACSPQVRHSLGTLHHLLRTWQETYPGLDLNLKAVFTKVNENFSAQVRMENSTPDTLQFAQLFPKVVEDMVMRVSTLPFHYYTQPKTYYEQIHKEYLSCAVPKVPKQTGTSATNEEIALLQDYRLAYLQGVRQQNVRGQTTKDKCVTLPLYAYTHDNEIATPVDFKKIFVYGQEDQRHILFSKNDIVTFNNNGVK